MTLEEIFLLQDWKPTCPSVTSAEKKEQLTFSSLCEKTAHRSSLHLDPSDLKELWIRSSSVIRGPLDAISVILVAEEICPYGDYFRLEHLEEMIWNKAKQARFDGKWKLVGETLQISPFIHGTQARQSFVFSNLPSTEFWGNVVPRMYNILLKELLTFREMYPKVPKNWKRIMPVTRKIRRRGYNDKGTMAKPHEDHGIPGSPISSVEEWKEQFRILKLEEKNKLLLSSSVKTPPSRFWFLSLNYYLTRIGSNQLRKLKFRKENNHD